MSEASIRTQTYLVCGVMIGCFSVLYPKIFHPMILNALGLSKSHPQSNPTQEHHGPVPFNPHGPHRPRPSFRPTEADGSPQGASKRGGLMGVILPLYAVGIVLYLLYTLSKLYKSRRGKNKAQKDEFLRHYYRGFHYDADRGKFRMGQQESSDEEGEDDEGKGTHRSSDGPSYANKNGCFDWAAAYGGRGQENLFRSAKSLPRDLEALLMKVEKQDPNNEELSAVRARLEHTEQEMSRLLIAIDQAEQMVKTMNKPTDGVRVHNASPADSLAEPERDSLYGETASEGEFDEPTDDSSQLEDVE